MAKLNENEKGFIAFIVIIIVVFIMIYIGNKMRSYVRNNGVYTIFTVNKIGTRTSGGITAKMHYLYRGASYNGSTRFNYGEIGIEEIGAKFYMIVVPSDPTNYMPLSDRVPSWFTLDAPPEGWVNRPKDEDLRKLMVADSISRGLKVADTLSKE